MLRFSTRFSLPVHLGIAVAGIVLLLAVWSGVPAARGESARTAVEGPREAGAAEAAATWQDTVKMFAAALAISLTAFATAITQRHIGSAGVGVLAENPKLFGNILIFLVIPETMVILGFVIAALILF
jgi:V/A-type H+-transporting ATPase subunit K